MPKQIPLNVDRIFGDLCLPYRYGGFYPRPITPGTKQCHMPRWQVADTNFHISDLDGWRYTYAHNGIGLLMGSPFPDGTRLGAIDIDCDLYVGVICALLGNPTVGKIGRRGVTYFVRVKGAPRKGEAANPEFRVHGTEFKQLGKVAECLFDRKLCVIPPTIHPVTEEPFSWIGPSLLDSPYTALPIVEYGNG